MGSSQSIPWYNRPPRPFPAQVWLNRQYPFLVAPSVFARQTGSKSALAGRRFPAQVWLERQQIR